MIRKNGWMTRKTWSGRWTKGLIMRFAYSWEQRKLGDIADIVGGGTPSTGNQSYWDGDIDCMHLLKLRIKSMQIRVRKR